MPDVAYVALGSNVGDRDAHLALARAAIAALPGVTVLRASTISETAALGPVPQGPFLNQMLSVRTTLEPRALLHALLDIERAAGRVRTVRWGPRTLDLDIVRYDDRAVREPSLVVPHPELGRRAFWRQQLGELGVRELSGAGEPALP